MVSLLRAIRKYILSYVDFASTADVVTTHVFHSKSLDSSQPFVCGWDNWNTSCALSDGKRSMILRSILCLFNSINNIYLKTRAHEDICRCAYYYHCCNKTHPVVSGVTDIGKITHDGNNNTDITKRLIYSAIYNSITHYEQQQSYICSHNTPL